MSSGGGNTEAEPGSNLPDSLRALSVTEPGRDGGSGPRVALLPSRQVLRSADSLLRLGSKISKFGLWI